MRWVRPEILLFALVALAGCASIISGRTQEVSFASNPEGVTVAVNGRILGKTPLTINLQKKSEQSLVFSKDGYKTLSMALETSIDGWFWGNIVLGGLIGSTTDGITGSVHKYAPSQYMVTLEPDGTNKMDGKPALSDQQKAKEYIVVAYKSLIEELTKNEKGEYVRSLLNILKIPEAQQDDAITKIRALSEVYKDIPVFADRVVEIFLK